MDNLYKDNNNLASVLSNHTKILELILDSPSLDHEELLNTQNQENNLARNLSNGFNTLSRDSFVNSKLVLTSVLIDETNEDIDTAINSTNDGKHGIIHPQILTPAMLKEKIKEFETLQRTRYHLDAEKDNYQHIIDISILLVAVIKGLFTYVLEIPVIEKDEGTMDHIIPIPHQVNDIFLSIIPDHDYVIKFRDFYIPTDKTSILL